MQSPYRQPAPPIPAEPEEVDYEYIFRRRAERVKTIRYVANVLFWTVGTVLAILVCVGFAVYGQNELETKQNKCMKRGGTYLSNDDVCVKELE